MINLPSQPLAICLSGGGSKGAYAVGILQYLYEVSNVRDIRILYGTSTGALITALFGATLVTGDPSYFQELINIYRSVKTPDVIKPHYEVAYELGGIPAVLVTTLVGGGISIFDTTPLETLLDRYMTSKVWNKIIQAGKADKPIEIGFCTTNLQTGKAEIFTNITHPDRTILRNATLASANQPVFMPPVQVDPSRTDQFVDGGVLDYNPIVNVFKSSIFNSVKGALAISLDTIEIPKDPTIHKKLDSVLGRTLSLLVDSVYDADITAAQMWNLLLKLKEILPANQWTDIVKQLPAELQSFVTTYLLDKKYLPIIHLHPEHPLQIDSLKFEQPAMQKLIKQGFQDAAMWFGNQTVPHV